MGGCPPPPHRPRRQAPHRNGTGARHRGRGSGGQDGATATCHRRSLVYTHTRSRLYTHHTVPGQQTLTRSARARRSGHLSSHGSCLSRVSCLSCVSLCVCARVPSVVCMYERLASCHGRPVASGEGSPYCSLPLSLLQRRRHRLEILAWGVFFVYAALLV